jgi:threonine dehydratase
VITGQGTIALGIPANHRPIDYLFVCMAAGVGIALVGKYLHPGIKVIGVRPRERLRAPPRAARSRWPRSGTSPRRGGERTAT